MLLQWNLTFSPLTEIMLIVYKEEGDICNIHVDDVIKREAVTLFLSTYRLFCRLYLITTELDAICPAGEYKQLCQSCIVQNLCWTFAVFQD